MTDRELVAKFLDALHALRAATAPPTPGPVRLSWHCPTDQLFDPYGRS